MSDTPGGPDWWQATDGKWHAPRTPSPSSDASPPPPPPSSDRQVAPDWWQASDGRWYPPRSALPPQPPASAPPPVQTSPYGPGPGWAPTTASVSGGLSGTLQGFLWASGGLSLIGAILALVGLVRFEEWWDTRSGTRDADRAFDEMTSADEAINSTIGLAGLAGLVVFILLLVWCNQAHKATQQLWSRPRKWTSGWTVGGWFIPVANAIIPKLVLNEIERIALAPRTGGTIAPDWPHRRTSAVGWWWWCLLVGGLFVGSIGSSLFDNPSVSEGSWRVGYWMTAVGYGAVALASAFGAVYVRRISRALSPKSMSGTR